MQQVKGYANVSCQVYLPAIAGHVPAQMVRALGAFLDFCYLVRRSVHTEASLAAVDDALARFQRDRVIFEVEGVCPDGISLPRQHSLVHYRWVIEQFGSLNGLCSSITESKHIKAVKEPWRRSNHYQALGQMLLTNQRLDKLAASRVDFMERGMLGHEIHPPADLTEAAPIPLDVQLSGADAGAVVGPRVSAEVTLAIRSGM
jgi:hypothetical protein